MSQVLFKINGGVEVGVCVYFEVSSFLYVFTFLRIFKICITGPISPFLISMSNALLKLYIPRRKN